MKNEEQEPESSREAIEPEVLEPQGNVSNGFYAESHYRNNVNNSGLWYFTTSNSSGCLPAFITLSLFIFCLGEFGILTGIGFMVYHIIIAIVGSLRAARKLAQGQPFNLWGWRCANWVISLLLVIWQSGGFNQ